jgi:hypothetical protein
MKRDNGLKAALADLMGEGPEAASVSVESGSQIAHEQTTNEPQVDHKRATSRPQKPKSKRNEKNLEGRHVRLAPADWKALDQLAEIEGSTISALVRRAIREMLIRSEHR